MDDVNIQKDSVQQPTQRTDDQRPRVEPKPEERDKFNRAVDKRGGKQDDEEAGKGVAASSDEEEGDSSIFGLSSVMNKGKKKGFNAPIKDALSEGQSKSDLRGINVSDDESSVGDSIDDIDEDGKNKNSLFAFDQEPHKDLFQLISTATQNAPVNTFDTTVSQKATNAITRQEAYDLAQQMIDKMSQVKTQGVTSTELTLKFPPLFEGSKVTLKEFDTAKGEFNISFENLSPQAKHMVDLEQSRETLRQTLQDRGYNVHIITTNTEIERPEYKQDANAARDGRQQGQDQGQQQQDQQQRKNK